MARIRSGISGFLGHCSAHGKDLWADRKTAKQAARERAPQDHTNAYRCDALTGWHWGHLGTSVIRGDHSRSDAYDPR